MMNVWTEAQKALWESWSNVMQGGMTNPATMFSGMFSGMPNTGMFDQWQKMATQGMNAWMGDSEPAAKNLSRQMVAAQATMMRFLEMTTRAWNTMLPKLEAGEDWQTVLNNYMTEFRKQMTPDVSQMMQASQGLGNLWQSYLQQFQATAQPWMRSTTNAPGFFGVAMAGEGAAALTDLTDMYWKAYEQTMGNMVNVPSVGFTRELEEKMAKGFAAWMKARQAMNDYMIVMSDGWNGVYEEVLKEMMNRAEQGKPIETVRDLVRMWTTVADRSFDQVFRSEKYSQVQGEFVSAYMEYRVHEQRIVDEMMKYSHFPTRTEMDEAHRNIYELRKEVKALKKQLNGAAKQPAAAPKKTTSTKKADAPAPAPAEKPAASADKPAEAPASGA